MADEAPIRWARKVASHHLRRLYESDAAGLPDEELVDEVGLGLYDRCVSILEVTAAVRGRAKCHGCGHVILHQVGRDEVMRCERCGWTTTWTAYRKSYKGKQLFGGAAIKAFEEFVKRYPGARTYSEKILLIDALIHEFPWNLIRREEAPRATRPAAANLIEFEKLRDALAFLDYLAGTRPDRIREAPAEGTDTAT
jgi:ribosomal protein L37AE/L43A